MYLLYTKNPLFTMWGFRGDNYLNKSTMNHINSVK